MNEVVQKIKNSQVEEIILKGEKITLRTKEGEELVSYKEASQGLLETLKEFGLTNEDLEGIKINVKSEAGSNFWLGIILSSILPLLLLLLFQQIRLQIIPRIYLMLQIYWMHINLTCSLMLKPLMMLLLKQEPEQPSFQAHKVQ